MLSRWISVGINGGVMRVRHWLFPAFIVFFLVAAVSCGSLSGEEYPGRMQEFIEEISRYVKTVKNLNDFIIIPQNGVELAFNDANPGGSINLSYINAIDGMGVEELFYNGSRLPAGETNARLNILKKLKDAGKLPPVMVSDYVSNDANIPAASMLSTDEGFLAFPRGKNNYDYMYIPAANAPVLNSKDINALEDAEHYLYLISDEKFATKRAMIDAIKAANYDVVLIDLFFKGVAFAPEDIAELQLKPNGKKRLVIAYISIGSAEKYRYYWKKGWKKGNPSWLKRKYEGYPDEFWVAFWDPEWQSIIYGYIDKILDAGFDGMYLDNVEAYYFLENR